MIYMAYERHLCYYGISTWIIERTKYSRKGAFKCLCFTSNWMRIQNAG